MDRSTHALKNTIYLYIRTGVQTVITLFSIRIVLDGLGVVDYGLYNTIGSIVALSSFINAAMTSSTQRFLSYEVGTNQKNKLSDVFNISCRLHNWIAALIFAVSEIVGVVFIYYYMNIELWRRDEMLIVLQLSIVTLLFNIIVVPYRSILISYERFDILSIVSIIEAFCKLGSAYVIYLFTDHRIIVYASLILITIFISNLIIIWRSHKYTCDLLPSKSGSTASSYTRQMLSFSGWNFLGGFGMVLMNQAISMLVNVFYGPVINAAQAVASQVNLFVARFVQDFSSAVNPQIVKSFAAKDYVYLHNVVFSSIKMAYFLMLIVSVPIAFNLDLILSLWLTKVPDYVSSFIICLLVNSCILSITGMIGALIESNGQVKGTQSCYTIILFFCTLGTYLLMRTGYSPIIIYYMLIISSIGSLFVRLYFAWKYKLINLGHYVYNVTIYIIPLTIVYLLLYYICVNPIKGAPWFRLIVSAFVSVLFIPLYGYYVFLDKHEKSIIVKIINWKIRS